MKTKWEQQEMFETAQAEIRGGSNDYLIVSHSPPRWGARAEGPEGGSRRAAESGNGDAAANEKAGRAHRRAENAPHRNPAARTTTSRFFERRTP